MYTGWIKEYRKLLDNPLINKPLHCHLWNILLLLAQHKKSEFIFANKKWQLENGQLLTGRKKLAELSGISESQVERILKYLKNEHQITQLKTNRFRIITIVNWEKYQGVLSDDLSDTTSEQQKDNKRTTEHTTEGHIQECLKNDKNIKNVKKNIYSPNSNEFRLSKLLLDLILERKSDYKKPDLQQWSIHTDRMLRLDGRSFAQVELVILWCQSDSFWQNNILSTEKLRKHFDKLELQKDERQAISSGTGKRTGKRTEKRTEKGSTGGDSGATGGRGSGSSPKPFIR